MLILEAINRFIKLIKMKMATHHMSERWLHTCLHDKGKMATHTYLCLMATASRIMEPTMRMRHMARITMVSVSNSDG